MTDSLSSSSDETTGLRMAYADPPYLGCCGLYDHHHPDGKCWDNPETHHDLIYRLLTEYEDGFALSLSTPSLGVMLEILRRYGHDPMDGTFRIMAWTKPFAAFKRNVRVAYAWEPLIVWPARRLEGAIPTRDFVAEPITMKRGFTGAKPERVGHWLFAAMGLRPGLDQLDDLYPGSGAVARAWESFNAQMNLEAAA